MRFWWCNQPDSWAEERAAGVVCASGEMIRNTNRKTVGEVRRGDIIIHYVKPEVVAFSRARTDGEHHQRLPALPGRGSGWQFDTEYFDLDRPISRTSFCNDIVRPDVKGYAINSNGHVGQGYFFRFDRNGLRVLLRHAVGKLPDWLEPLREPPAGEGVASLEHWDELFRRRVAESMLRTPEERRERLRGRDGVPTKRTVLTTVHERDPDVVAEVLDRAGGRCEKCRSPAPFARASDGSPYLEVHHKKRLADGGLDTVDNAVALCPNCHREEHYG